MKARVTVTLKSGILDPQGKAIEGALKSLGVARRRQRAPGQGVRHRDRGRRPRARPRRALKEAADKLLANTVIENLPSRGACADDRHCAFAVQQPHMLRSPFVAARLGVVAIVGAGLAERAADGRLARSGSAGTTASGPLARRVQWPFPLDQWGTGRAFQLRARPTAASKSTSIVRAKIGFCNCTTGVSDDDELDRVGDVELYSDKFVPLERRPAQSASAG